MQDKTGDLADSKSNVFYALRSSLNILSGEQPQLSSRTWQIALESASGDWLDASGVQRYLCDKRVIIENLSDSSGHLDYSVSSSLDVTTFVKSEFLGQNVRKISTNATAVLSKEGICVGNGPVFRQQSVEKALRLATTSLPWDFDHLCDL
jgi:hypothetical protein